MCIRRICSAPTPNMLNFSTGKKKKRDWREMAAEQEGEETTGADEDDDIDEAELERQMAVHEKEVL